MAVPVQTPYIEYTANGSTNSFALEFDCENQDHLIVLVDEVDPVVGTWSLSGGAVVFGTAPATGKKVTIQRNTPFRRDEDFQSYDNSFRPPGVNKGFDKIWLKLQELGVADWILKNRFDGILEYINQKDDDLKSYLLGEIEKQGVALDQLEDYYNYLMERLANIAIDRGWDANFVTYNGRTQKKNNDGFESVAEMLSIVNPKDGDRVFVKSYHAGVMGEAQPYKGGGDFVYSTAKSDVNNGGTILNGWVRIYQIVTPEMFGAKANGIDDDTAAVQATVNTVKKIRLTDSDYKFSTISVPSKRKIRGAGKGITKIIPSDSADLFNITANDTYFESFTIEPFALLTAGTLFKVPNGNRIGFKDISAYSYFNGFDINGTVINFEDIELWFGAQNGTGILLGDTAYTGMVDIISLKMINNTPAGLLAQPYCGIILRFVDVIHLDDILTIGQGTSIYVNPKSGQTASLIGMTNCCIDTSNFGMTVAPEGTGRVIRNYATNCWFGENSISGLVFNPGSSSSIIDGFTFNNCQIGNNKVVNVNLDNPNNGTLKGIHINNSEVYGSPVGVRADNCGQCFIGGNTIIGNVASGAGNTVGIAVSATAQLVVGDDVVVSGNTSNYNVPSNAIACGIPITSNIALTATIGVLTSYTATAKFTRRLNGNHSVSLNMKLTNVGTAAGGLIATLPVVFNRERVLIAKETDVVNVLCSAFVGENASALYIYKYDGGTVLTNNYRIALSD